MSEYSSSQEYPEEKARYGDFAGGVKKILIFSEQQRADQSRAFDNFVEKLREEIGK